jgi:hypothetical protein
MAEQLSNTTRRKPILGWISVASAGTLCALVVGIPTMVTADVRSEGAGGGSIGVATGGLGSVVLILLALFVMALLAAIIGAIRGERPVWVHGVGLLLTVAAPAVGIAVLRAWFG